MSHKLILYLSGFCVLLMLIGFVFFFTLSKKASDGFVSGIFGEENYVVKDKKKAQLKLNALIQAGDTVITGTLSSLEITFTGSNGRTTILNIYENSELKIQETFLKSKNKFQLNLLLGYIKVIVKNLLQTDEFKVRTPNATIGVRGTKFYAQYVKESQTTHLHVIEISEKKEVVITPANQAETIVPVMTTATVVKTQPSELNPLDTHILPKDPIYIRDLEGLKKLLMKGKTEAERYRVYTQKTDGDFIFGKAQKELRGNKLVFKFEEVEEVEVYFESSKNRDTLNKNMASSSSLPIYYAFYSPDQIRVKKITGHQETSAQDVYGHAEGHFFKILLWESPAEEIAPITLEKVATGASKNKIEKTASDETHKEDSKQSESESEDARTKIQTPEDEKVHACLRLAKYIDAKVAEDSPPSQELQKKIDQGWQELEGKDFGYRKNLYELIYQNYVLGDELKCKSKSAFILYRVGFLEQDWLKKVCDKEFLSGDTSCPKRVLEICSFSESQCKKELNTKDVFYASLRSETVLEKCNFDEVEHLNIKLDEAHEQDDSLYLRVQKQQKLHVECLRSKSSEECESLADEIGKARKKWKDFSKVVTTAYEAFYKAQRDCKPIWVDRR